MNLSELEIKDKTSNTEGIKFARFKKHIRKTNPHKHNSYFEIIYLSKGKGTHTIDTITYEIKAPIIFMVRKEQVHFWDIQSMPEGFVLIIKKSYIDNCLDPEIKRLISELSAHPCLFPKNKSLSDLLNLLLSEFIAAKTSTSTVIEGLIKVLLAKSLELAKPSPIKMINNSIFEQFTFLLLQENHLNNKVNYYADLLHTSPQNLNAICRKETQQSASQLITDHIINEAKRLLFYTDNTVSEIADQLNFKDNSHFSKYFKKQAGTTPIGFRSENI